MNASAVTSRTRAVGVGGEDGDLLLLPGSGTIGFFGKTSMRLDARRVEVELDALGDPAS